MGDIEALNASWVLAEGLGVRAEGVWIIFWGSGLRVQGFEFGASGSGFGDEKGRERVQS